MFMSIQVSVSEITLKFDRIENADLNQLGFSFQNQSDDSEISANLDNSLILNKPIPDSLS